MCAKGGIPACLTVRFIKFLRFFFFSWLPQNSKIVAAFSSMVFNFIETIKFNKNFGVCYAGIKVFNYLPTSIKSIASDTEVSKKTSKRFLMVIPFILWMSLLILRNNVFLDLSH